MIQNPQVIYQGEIFQKSNCINLENSVMDQMANQMRLQGWQSHDRMHKIWRRNHQTMIHCTVDDFFTCGDTAQPTAHLFDSDTTVVTDNWVNCEVDYEIMSLPASFFGIYAYCPELQDWNPQARFGFCVNRIDPLRIELLCEIIDVDQDLVNFNCYDHNHANTNTDDLKANFSRYQSDVTSDRFDYYANVMPLKNHSFTVEQVQVNAKVNLVLETYAGNNTVALSEKTFRALQTPAPWLLFAGRGAVQRLQEFGFDVLSDQVDHDYDNEQNYAIKIKKFKHCAMNTAERSFDSQRLQKAALHNQNLLANLRTQWPTDWAQWWPKFCAKVL